MPEEKIGIKETTEALKAVNELTIFFANAFKDGVELQDFEVFWNKLMNDVEFKKIINDGYDNYKLIPSEMKDIDLTEGLTMASLQITYIPRLVEAFKKPPVVHPIGK
jgi:hypothetical protein